MKRIIALIIALQQGEQFFIENVKSYYLHLPAAFDSMSFSTNKPTKKQFVLLMMKKIREEKRDIPLRHRLETR